MAAGMKTSGFQVWLRRALAGMATGLAGAGVFAAPLTWFPGADLNEPRSSAAAVAAPGGSILVFGGSPLGSTDVLVYGQNHAQPIPSTRVGPGAVALSSSQFFVYGGKQTNTATSVTSSVLSYNPVSSGTDDPDVFTVAAMSARRYDMAYAADAAGYAYAIGGLGNNNTVLATVERYNSLSNRWASVASLPAGRYHFSAVFDGTDTIYTFGGRTNATLGTETATVLGYSVSGNAWSALASLPVATAGSAAIMGADGKCYVIGGTAGGGVTNLVQVYDPATRSWALSTPLPASVTAAGGVVDALGRLVVLGGADGGGVDLTTTWVSQQLNQPDTAPVFALTVPPVAVYQVPYAYTNTAAGNPQPVYQLIAGPAGMQVDPFSGAITWTPQADQMGGNEVTIQASNYAGTTNRTFTINAVGPTPDAPANVAVAELGENSVTLAWDPVTPVVGSVNYTVYHWVVQYAGKGSTRGKWVALLSGLTSPSGTIGGLLSGSSHTYTVTASAAGAESGYSSSISITTLTPQPPANLRISALTSTTVTLAWDPPTAPPEPIANYEVWGWINNGVTSTVYGTGITNTTLTITGLAPGSWHEWGVRDHDVGGNVSFFDIAAGGQSILNPVPTPATLAGPGPGSGGAFQFTVQTAWAQTTWIQATTNPADPTSWQTIATNPPTGATFTFTDPDANLFPTRCYRVVNQ